MKDIDTTLEEIDNQFSDEVIDLEEYAKEGKRPPPSRKYRIRIDKQYYVVEKPSMIGRDILILADKKPPERFMLSQKLRGGEKKKIGLDEKVDFATPGIERFLTLPLDQTEG